MRAPIPTDADRRSETYKFLLQLSCLTVGSKQTTYFVSISLSVGTVYNCTAQCKYLECHFILENLFFIKMDSLRFVHCTYTRTYFRLCARGAWNLSSPLMNLLKVIKYLLNDYLWFSRGSCQPLSNRNCKQTRGFNILPDLIFCPYSYLHSQRRVAKLPFR